MAEASLLATLQGLKVSIIHPDRRSASALAASLTELGCQTSYCWPLPVTAPAEVDLLLLAIEPHSHRQLLRLVTSLHDRGVPVIALADYQHSALFPLLMTLKPAAILDKVINPFALIVQIIGTLGWVRQCATLRKACQPLLDEPKARLTRAKGILMREQGMDEHSAYHLLRRAAMDARCSLDHTAERVIAGRGYPGPKT